MRTITLEELLEAGCHFGHQVTRQNPKARDFVFEERDNIHIIDLAKTKEGLEQAAKFIKSLAQKEESHLLILGSKRQAAPVVKQETERALKEGAVGLFSVTNRWMGGTFTNFAEVSKNYRRLEDLKKKLNDPEERSNYTKKEILLWEREKQKLESFYGGVVSMKKLPDAIFVIDTHEENLAVREASRTGVKIVGIVDTNADPDPVNYPIPANDDAQGSIELITKYIIDAWIEGRKQQEQKPQVTEEEKPKPKKEIKKKKTEKKILKTSK